MKCLRNETGLTLVEVLASIVILSLIVVTFLTFFINSARTTEMSEDTLDASFFAQQYIEEVYNIAAMDGQTLASIHTAVVNLQDISSSDGTIPATYTINNGSGTGMIIIEPAQDKEGNLIDRLLKVVVTFNVSGNSDAKHETRMIFGEGDLND
ncbi:type II secretory pathway pseudopilin PulG [Streptohalobacillus salinus]|uniref:Type II secretory pathway pseudopilin PulG n=1 Tax=Streptohalobacillus salinus TaxID=621096 RepID=A0A2V3WMW0_9BACI|nr:type II secretion system protein [Streptohalobacillus salinus]PXW90039.1 type II secretory pathway pseudopilin PulG [Streptohalobacillus salinus]